MTNKFTRKILKQTALMLIALIMLSACGQKGDLYLPENGVFLSKTSLFDC